MGRYMYAHIIKSFEVSKIGNRNQLFYLDKDEIELVENELKKVIDFTLYDFIKSPNKVEVILKDDVMNKNFRSLIDEINLLFQLDGHGFMYESDNVFSYFEQPLFGNKSYLISENLYKNGLNISVSAYSFMRDCEMYGNGNDIFISYLLTRLLRSIVDNKLSNSVIFSVD